MSKMIQIRNVPDELHRKVKARAAQKGMTISSYLTREIERIMAMPSWEEFGQRIEKRPPVKLNVSIADLIRADRDSR